MTLESRLEPAARNYELTEAEAFYTSQLSQQEIEECQAKARQEAGDFSANGFTFKANYVRLLLERYRQNIPFYFRRQESAEFDSISL